MLGASAANVYQAGKEAKRHPLFALLAWSMAIGAVIDDGLAFAVAGPPVFDPRPGYWVGLLYLALFASVLAFSLYFPVVRKIGPGQGGLFERDRADHRHGLSTAVRGLSLEPAGELGGVLALGGMLLALAGRRRPDDACRLSAPDAPNRVMHVRRPCSIPKLRPRPSMSPSIARIIARRLASAGMSRSISRSIPSGRGSGRYGRSQWRP